MNNELKELIIYSMIESEEPFSKALKWAADYLEMKVIQYINIRDLRNIEESVFNHLKNNFSGRELKEEAERRGLLYLEEVVYYG